MSWHKAAAVLTLALAPAFATAAHAKPHRHHPVGHWIVRNGAVHHHGRYHSGHQRLAGIGHHRVARRGAGDRPGWRAGSGGSGWGSPAVLAVAAQYRGTNPTGRSSQWCAAFANLVLRRTGHSGTGSAVARSFAHYGSAAPGPAPGVIAVWRHHVGFVIGTEGPGRIRVVSGNHSRRVGEGVYPTRGIIAYRYPA